MNNTIQIYCIFYVQGEFPYPDTSKWTDEELGIPPDDHEENETMI